MTNSIFVPDRGSHNVYHFFIYMLTNLRFIEYTPDIIYIDTKKYFFKEKENFIILILKLLYPNVIIIDSEVSPKDCEILKQNPSPPNRESGVSPEEYIFLRNLFLPILESYIPSRNYSENIYISRCTDSTKRRVLNENILFENVSDFEIVVMSELTILDQMYIFYKAKTIISIHGAALVNILFCNKNVNIVEIASNSMSRLKHYEDIADVLELNYKKFTDVIESIPNSYESDVFIRTPESFFSFVR